MKRLVIFLLLSATALTSCRKGPVELKQTEWLVGRWIGKQPEGYRFVMQWNKQADTALTETGSILYGGEMQDSEQGILYPRGKELYYTLQVKSEEKLPALEYRLVSNDPEKLIFHNLTDTAQSLILEKSGQDSIIYTIKSGPERQVTRLGKYVE